MKNSFLLMVMAFFVSTGSVDASNITIYDRNPNEDIAYWDPLWEDGEVEPGMVQGQEWDLEGFFTHGSQLSLIGGYDFINGKDGIMSGDIFIDVTEDAVYGDIHDASKNNRTVKNTYGYDYVVDLDWNTETYSVWAINDQTDVETAFYQQNQGSSPWRYVSGGTQIPLPLDSNTIYYETGLSNEDVGFLGGDHNKLTVDLGFLLGIQGLADSNGHVSFIAHYTMECGNDNIMGSGTIPNPEPSTLLLIGFGLLGAAKLGRKK